MIQTPLLDSTASWEPTLWQDPDAPLPCSGKKKSQYAEKKTKTKEGHPSAPV